MKLNAQVYDIQISHKGKVSHENYLTAAVYLPYRDVITRLTDNSFSLNLIPNDSIAIDDLRKIKRPTPEFTFGRSICNSYSADIDRFQLERPTKNEINYSYTNVYSKGCGTGGAWRESDYYRYNILTRKNKIRSIQFENIYTKPKGQKKVKYRIEISYTRYGKVKRMKLSSGDIYKFEYDKKKRIEKIDKLVAKHRNAFGYDSVRTIFRIFRFGNQQYVFNESVNRFANYYSAFERAIPTYDVMRRYNKLRLEYPVFLRKLDSLYELDSYPEDKLALLDSIDIELEDQLDSLTEIIDEGPRLYHLLYKGNNLIRISDRDDYNDYLIQDSFAYNKKGNLIKHITYEESNDSMKETFIWDYEYSARGKLSSLTYYDVDRKSKKSKEHFLRYFYDSQGRINKIRKLTYSDYSEPYDNLFSIIYE